ncbi:MAG: ribbon-helix-helix protein, CopG family [Deltaproteobacteria bacterium]|nr:ribbon-helix-helix protein, CopG family [Deltaproteobacteria bacterium]
MVTMNISLDDDLAKALEELAKRAGKPIESVVAETMREHVEYSRRLIASIEAGLRDADAGRVHSIEEVEAELARRRAARAR